MYGPHIDRDEFTSELTCSCCQFYLNGSTGKSWKSIKHWDYPEDFHYYTHCPVNLNLAKEANFSAHKTLIKILKEIKDTPGSAVLHIGTLGTIELVAERINSITIPQTQNVKTLLLENSAGQGSYLGRNYRELRKLFEAIDDKSRIGLCIDTQHSFASGLCSFKNEASVDKLFDKLQDIAIVPMIHLNDSETEFRSLKDRHAPLGTGYIWGTCTESLKYLLERCTEKNIDLICETKKFAKDQKIVTSLLT